MGMIMGCALHGMHMSSVLTARAYRVHVLAGYHDDVAVTRNSSLHLFVYTTVGPAVLNSQSYKCDRSPPGYRLVP